MSKSPVSRWGFSENLNVLPSRREPAVAPQPCGHLFGGAAAIGVGLAQGSRLVMVGGAVSLVIGVSAIVYTHLR